MHVIVVDDEQSALEVMAGKLKAIPEIREIYLFDDPTQALSHVEENRVDVAFLDVEMYDINGLAMARQIKEIAPDTNIIFVSGYMDYMRDAFSLHVSGYLMKPVSGAQLKEELENLRYPIRPSTRVRVQTFGNFEVYVDDVPLQFGRTKAKEALAYLIDRKGALVTSEQLAAVLYEDKPYDRAMQKLIHAVLTDMKNTLKEKRAEEILRRQSRSYAVDPKKFRCDAYDFAQMIPYAINAYRGEYMVNYSWSEFTTGILTSQLEGR